MGRVEGIYFYAKVPVIRANFGSNKNHSAMQSINPLLARSSANILSPEIIQQFFFCTFEAGYLFLSGKLVVMNIEAQKAIIIEQVKQVNDIDLISAIKSMLDYAQKREQKQYDIPEAHQNLVLERFALTRENPDRLLDWEEAKRTLKT